MPPPTPAPHHIYIAISLSFAFLFLCPLSLTSPSLLIHFIPLPSPLQALLTLTSQHPPLVSLALFSLHPLLSFLIQLFRTPSSPSFPLLLTYHLHSPPLFLTSLFILFFPTSPLLHHPHPLFYITHPPPSPPPLPLCTSPCHLTHFPSSPHSLLPPLFHTTSLPPLLLSSPLFTHLSSSPHPLPRSFHIKSLKNWSQIPILFSSSSNKTLFFIFYLCCSHCTMKLINVYTLLCYTCILM